MSTVYKIKNGSHRGKAFKVAGGLHVVAAGDSAEVEVKHSLTEAEIAAYARDGVSVKEVKAAADTAAKTEPAKKA